MKKLNFTFVFMLPLFLFALRNNDWAQQAEQILRQAEQANPAREDREFLDRVRTYQPPRHVNEYLEFINLNSGAMDNALREIE